MKIAIVTVQVPFTSGGAENLTGMLKNELIKRGHQAEIVTIPFKWYPWEVLVSEMNIGRAIDLTETGGDKIDLVIAMKFPAYYLKHDNKVLWLMHQHRQAYDMWNSDYSDIQRWENGESIRKLITACDSRYLAEYKTRFTISQNTSARLMKYNHLKSKALYHPPLHYEQMHCDSYGDFVFYPSRISQIKRQELLVDAAGFLTTDAKIIIAGSGTEADVFRLKNKIKEKHLEDKVFYAGLISEEEKIKYYANCMAVYFGAYDEDYGYITLEGMFSEKPVIVHRDAGGPLEFITDGKNGYVIEPEPEIIAKTIDKLYKNKDLARKLGVEGKNSLLKKNMNWDYVIQQLLRQR